MGFPNTVWIAYVVKFVVEEHQIRVIAPLYFNDYAARNSLAAVPTCTPPHRRAMMCLYLRHQAFRSEQSRHGWKATASSFSL